MFGRRRLSHSFFISCSYALLLASCSSTPEPQVVSKELAQMPAALNPAVVVTPKPLERKLSTQPIAQTSLREFILEPKAGAVGVEWGVHPYELRQQAQALENFIRYGRYPKQYCNRGVAKKANSKKLCQQVNLIVSSYKKNSRNGIPKRRYGGLDAAKTGRSFRISPQNFAWVQSRHFDDVMDSISSLSTQQVLNWTPTILKTSSCPRNLSAAAIRKLENLLPENEAKVAIEKLYAHAATCLKPADSAYAITHFRQALLRVLWGDQTRARISASLAPLGAKGEELPRTLFWAGLLQSDPVQREQYWNRLITDHPLSFHAINAHKQLGRDPLADAINRPVVTPSRDGNSPELNLSMRWFEALMLNGSETGASRLAFWMAANFKDDMSLGNIIYITHLKADRTTHQSSFGFVWNQIESNPENMNEQTLKLMFPLPYWEIFKKASGRNDPMLLVSVARQESAFNPQARSPMNARGLLQLLPATAHAMAGSHVNLYAPETNARLGSKFLGNMVNKFQSVELALAAYNAGPLRIPQWRKRFPTKSSLLFIDLIPYKETRNYVANILRNNYWYTRLYDNTPLRAPASRTQSVLVSSLIQATKNIKSAIVPVAVAASANDPQAR